MKIAPINPVITPTFGAGMPMGGMTRGVDTVFSWLGANRTREMLVEDFVGFGLLRTTMDLFRGHFFGQEEKLNIPAARERLFRETCSIITDNMTAGVAAFGLAKILDRGQKSFGGKFVDFTTLDLFQDLMKQTTTEQGFLKQLATAIAGGDARLTPRIQRILTTEPASEQAVSMARALGQREFDVAVKGRQLRLDDLVENWGILKKQVQKTAYRGNWGERARALTQRTLRNKKWMLWCLGLGAALTMAVPVFNHWLTRKVDKIETYPGELGRTASKTTSTRVPAMTQPVQFQSGAMTVGRGFSGFVEARNQPVAEEKSWLERYAPFVSGAMKEGNPVPALLALAPLPFAVGLFDTVKRRFVNPFQKGFGKRLQRMYDFGKRFPFTTQQQIASLFAFLIMSRLFTSRSENEFRERLVDSSLGWGLWILATPWIKEKVARVFDRVTGSQLLKKVGGQYQLRTRTEIERLLPKAVAPTLKKSIWIGAVSTVVTMLLLGVVEPYLAIQWTKRNTAPESDE